MNTRVLGVRALPVTFLVFVVEAALAVFASFPLGVELAPRLRELSLDPPALHELITLARAYGRSHLLAIVTLLLLAPWLQMSWLIMLSEPQSPLGALARGIRAMPRAWLVSLCLGLAFSLCVAPFAGVSYAMFRAFGDDPNARRTDLLVLTSLLPLLPIAFYFQVAHDLARAATLECRSLRSTGRGLYTALKPRAFGPAFGAISIGLALPLAAHASSWQLAALPATILLQTVLLVRLLVRGAWLGHALSCVRVESPMPTGKYDE